jgi:hypothetical protein
MANDDETILDRTARLVGSWSLVSYEVTLEGGSPDRPYGALPNGRLILGANGRMAVVMAAEGRRYGPSDTERAALHRAMMAYSGRYRVEGDEFITTVDVSSNLIWEGTEQARRFRLDGPDLVLDLTGLRLAEGRLVFAPNDAGETGIPIIARLVWRREV